MAGQGEVASTCCTAMPPPSSGCASVPQADCQGTISLSREPLRTLRFCAVPGCHLSAQAKVFEVQKSIQ